MASYKHDKELMEWYLEAIRGLWFGFYRGFFHERQRPQKTCLSANVEDEMTEIMQFLAYGELYDIFKVADSMTNLYYDNRLGCGYVDIVKTIKETCSDEKEDDDKDGAKKKDCKIGTIFNNLFTEHMFESMGQGTTLANALKEFTLHVDKEVIHEQTLVIGKASGSLLAFAFDV